jgi:chromosome condensin MukBEF ATPase and DNA-binding subunit MukB
MNYTKTLTALIFTLNFISLSAMKSDDLTTTLATLESNRNAITTTHANFEFNRKKMEEEYKTAVEKLKKMHNLQLETTKEEYKSKLSQEKTSYEESLNTIQRTYNQRLLEIKEEYATLETINGQLVAKINDANKGSAEAIIKLKKEYTDKVSQLEQDLAYAKAYSTTLKKDLTDKLTTAEKNYITAKKTTYLLLTLLIGSWVLFLYKNTPTLTPVVPNLDYFPA